MIRSVILMVLISISITQCVPPNNKVPPLKLNKFIKPISANGKLFGGVKNFTKPFGHFKSSIDEVNFQNTINTKSFGERADDDHLIGYAMEVNYFDTEQDIDVTISYPKVGIGKIVVNYVEVLVQAEKNPDIKDPKAINQKEFEVEISGKDTRAFLFSVLLYGKVE